MTPDRFRMLVDAYGADPRHWPADERIDAQQWAHRHAAQADIILADAARLDAWLATDRVAPPAAALAERIVAGAPGAPWHRLGRPPLWWSGALAAGAVGAVAGALLVSLFMAGATPPASYHAPSSLTGFSNSTEDWGGE